MSTTKTAKTVSVRAPDAPKGSASLRISSQSFTDGAALSNEFVFTGCGGNNTSPQLSWTGAPDDTKSFAITCFDPDAPTGSGYWHWILFNLPNDVTALQAGEGNDETPRGATSGYNDFGMNGYAGPCPPKGDGQHRYIFTVYALDVDELQGGSSATGATTVFLMRGHVLASGSITGLFGH